MALDVVSEISEISNAELKEEFLQYNTQSVPVLRSFVVKYGTSLVLVFTLVCVIAFTALTSLNNITDYVSEVSFYFIVKNTLILIFYQIEAAAMQRVLGSRLIFDSYCLAFSPYDELYSEPYRHRIIEDALELEDLDYKLRFGDKVNKEKGIKKGSKSAKTNH